MLYGVIAAFAAAFIVSALLGKPIIRKLRELKFGQKILEDFRGNDGKTCRPAHM